MSRDSVAAVSTQRSQMLLSRLDEVARVSTKLLRPARLSQSKLPRMTLRCPVFPDCCEYRAQVASDLATVAVNLASCSPFKVASVGVMDLRHVVWLADALSVAMSLATVVVGYVAASRLRFVTRPLVLLVVRWQLLPALVGVVVGLGLLSVISPARWWIVNGVAVLAELVVQLCRPRLVRAVLADPVASTALASSENRVWSEGWLHRGTRSDMLSLMTLLVAAVLGLVWLIILPLRAVWPLWAPGNTFIGGYEGGGGG